MSAKNLYQLLNVEPSADTETIKKSFRREIARYHPDKVVHLGQEFQDMASARAAELTAAYKILCDPSARADYDAELEGGGVRTATAAPPASSATTTPDEPADAPSAREPETPIRRFDEERAGRDDIMRRAVLLRVREVLQQEIGDCEMRNIPGFDLACLAKSGPNLAHLENLFKRSTVPSVVVVLTTLIDRQAIVDAWRNAVRARISQKPLVLLLIGHQLAPGGELARAIEEARIKNQNLQDVWFPVPVDIRDWAAKVPANAPASVRTLMSRLREHVS